MKKRTKFISTALVAMLHCFLAAVVVLTMSRCSPKVNIPDIQIPEITTRPDTVIRVVTTKQIDTVEMAGYIVEVHDTFPCPAGLERDTNYYVTFNHYLPGNTIITTKTVHDTTRLVSALPAPALIPSAGAGWSERLGWLGGVLLLLAALWKKWKQEQQAKAA